MENTKLVYFLKHLSEKELEAFRFYVGSPLFNRREALKRLLNTLEKSFLKKNTSASKESIYREVYGEAPFRESSLKTSMTQLLGLLLDFLAFSEFQEDQVARRRYMLKKLNGLGEQKFFSAYHARAESELAKSDISSSDQFHELMLLEEEYEFFRTRKPGRDPHGMMQGAVENLGNSFLVRMLRYNIRVLNRKAKFRASHQSKFMEMALDYIRKELEHLPLVVRVYFLLYEALRLPDELEWYSSAQALLADSVDELSRLEAIELYTSAMNFAARKLNEGHLEFLSYVFGLYQEMLRRKFIIDEGKISPWHYKNIVNVGLRLKEFVWVNEFMESWKHNLSRDYKENVIHFTQGMVKYYKGEFKVAERHFNHVLDDYKDVFYGLNARGYLLQIYFETGNGLGMESLSHSFRMFLDRNKEISEQKQQQYIAFINHLRKLTNIPLHDTQRLKNLYSEIVAKNRKGMGSEWLLAKLQELIGETVKMDG